MAEQEARNLYDVWAAAMDSEGIAEPSWDQLAGVVQHAWIELASFVNEELARA